MKRQEKEKLTTFALRQWLKTKHTRSPWGEKLDSNGYSESLLPSDGCFLCGVGGDLARHEIYGGADRQTSKAVGMWGYFCPRCHGRAHAEKDVAELLHKEGQAVFEKVHSHEEFIALFGRNYL